MRLALSLVAAGSLAVGSLAPTAAQTAQAPDPNTVAATAALARAARAALDNPASPAPWAEMRARLRNERLRKGIAVPDAAERIAATIADSLGPAITGIRIDPVERQAEVSIAADGVSFRVAPPVVERGRIRVFIDVLKARSVFAVKSFPWLRDGGVLGMSLDEDATGTRITLDLRPRSRFRALVGAGGLLLRVEEAGYHVRPWAVAAPGAPEPPRVQAPEPGRATIDAPAGVGSLAQAQAAPTRAGRTDGQSLAPEAARTDALSPAPEAGTTTTDSAAIAAAVGASPLAASVGPWHDQRRAAPRQDAEMNGPLSPPQMLLLLALVLLPPFLALRYASHRRAGTPGAAAASAGEPSTSSLTPEPAEDTLLSEAAADTALLPPPSRRRRIGLLGWTRRTAEAAREADSRLWVARTLASNGAPPVDVARRLRLSRDAVMLLGRAERARQG